MMRYILVAIALLAGIAGVGYLSQSYKMAYGVFDGVGVAYEGHYFLIDGKAVKTPVNATILYGKFILWGGYLLNGTEVKPRHVTAAVVTSNVVVVSGSIQVLVGEVHTIGNYTVVTGNPARVLVIDGYVYHPK
jgi:tRNA G37 N-methylase TrmD